MSNRKYKLKERLKYTETCIENFLDIEKHRAISKKARKALNKDKPVLGNIHNYLEKVIGGFHFNCEEFLINTGNIYSAKPSSKDIAKLANIFFHKWHVPKPYDLTSEYMYPYVIKSNDE